MTIRLVTDSKLLEALDLLGLRFTTAELARALEKVGIVSTTQASYWLRRDRPGHRAWIRPVGRVKHGRLGRPMLVYEVTEFGKKLLYSPLKRQADASL